MSTLHDFLMRHGPELVARCGHSEDAQLFFDPAAQLKTNLDTTNLPTEGPVAVALDAALQRVSSDPELDLGSRLSMHAALCRRAASFSATGGLKLPTEVVELLNFTMHDMRTPLVTIRGYAEMMLRDKLGVLTETQRHYIGVMLRNSFSLDDQIDTFLDYVRLEQGRITIHPHPVSLHKVLRKSLEGFKALAEQKKLTLNIDVPKSDVEIMANDEKLRRVLRNLLDNAIKFTDRGGRIDLRFAATDDGRFEISVADCGCGIGLEDQSRIFEAFSKASPESKTKGIGLGLTVANALIAAHGARLHLKSAPGEGSRFWFSLPLAR